MIQYFLSDRMIHTLGWTLVHSLWQAALFAIALGLLLLALRKFSARARYNLAIGVLAAFCLTTVLTFTQLYETAAKYSSLAKTEEASLQEGEVSLSATDSRLAETPLAPQNLGGHTLKKQAEPIKTARPTLLKRIGNYYDIHLPLIVTLWLMGVLILQLRFIGQLAYLQRLKNYGVERFPSHFAPMLQELETKLKLSKPVQYLSSFRVSSPFTAGWLRPVILFPATLLDQLNEPELRTIIAHELAHIQRHDFLVNLIQTLLCILFFYHPAVWWMSARIEEEREHCCDDMAIKVTGERIGYAKTLLALKEAELDPKLAVGLKGKHGFKQRVTRLLSGSLRAGTYQEGFVSALILVSVLASAIGLSGQASTLITSQSDIDLMDIEEQESAPTISDELIATAPERKVDPETGEELISATTSPNDIAAFVNDSTVFCFLLEAIDDGNLPLVKYFLRQGIQLNREDQFGRFPLSVAAGEKQPTIVKLLIENGADVNYLSKKGFTAIIEAADEGAYECTKILLKNGADPELRGRRFRRDALSMAASEGHKDVMQLLMQEIENTPRSGFSTTIKKETTPLHEAAEEGQLEIVEMLISSGVKVNAKDKDGRTPLSYAAEEGNARIVEILLKNGAKPNDLDQEKRSAMSYAAEEGFPTIVSLLNKYGGTFRGKDLSGRTALDYAIGELADFSLDRDKEVRNQGRQVLINGGSGLSEVIRQLIGQGASTNGVSLDEKGRVVIKLEAFEHNQYGEPQSHIDIFDNGTDEKEQMTEDHLVQLIKENELKLLEKQLIGGANPNILGEDNYTPLTMAARENNKLATRLLLNAGADPDQKDFHGMTAIEIALQENYIDILRQLNDNGDAVTALRPDGTSPLSRPAREGHLEVLRFLLEQGCSPNGGKGPSPLFYAARENNVEAVRMLLDHGADLNPQCNTRDTDYFGRKYPEMGTTIALYQGLTPLMAAITDQNIETAKLLIRRKADVNAKCLKVRYLSRQKLSWKVAASLTPTELEKAYRKAYIIKNWTPLLEAVESNNLQLVQLLLNAGADENHQASNGLTPLALAKQMGNKKIINLFD